MNTVAFEIHNLSLHYSLSCHIHDPVQQHYSAELRVLGLWCDFLEMEANCHCSLNTLSIHLQSLSAAGLQSAPEVGAQTSEKLDGHVRICLPPPKNWASSWISSR
jgi:hypothetical protein